MKILTSAYFALIVASFLLIAPNESHAEKIQFNWAVLADSDSGVRALDFSTPQTLKKGSTLQLYLHPDPSTFVYIFLLDSNNSFSPLFPHIARYYDRNQPGSEVRIPAGEDRFTIVPPPGQEKFYIIASPFRLVRIEKIVETFLQNPGDIETQAKLFQEVRHLRRKYSTLTQATEKGMPVSGVRKNLNATRGSTNNTFIATQVEAFGFYSKIIRLNHE